MTDYLGKKRAMFGLIDSLVHGGTFTVDEITFAVVKETGFGKKTILEYINDSIKQGFFVINKKGNITKQNKDENNNE